MERVKCRVCTKSDGKKCTLKNVKVAQNKSRVCTDFKHDPSKIKVKRGIKSEYIPFHLRDRKAYKKYVKEMETKQAQETMDKKLEAMRSPDCLSQFRSSASE